VPHLCVQARITEMARLPSNRLRIPLVAVAVSVVAIVWFSVRSWRSVDLINIPLTTSGPYLSVMTYRSGIWIDVHDYIGSYEGTDPSIEVSFDDDGMHSIPFQEEFQLSSLVDFRFSSTGSIPLQLTFPLWILGLPGMARN
jgi:hypothetical protein